MSPGLITFSLIVGVVSAMGVLIVKIVIDNVDTPMQITWKEFAIGSLIVVPVVSVAVCGLGWKLAWDNKVTFNEYWNGWEKSTSEELVACTRDGACIHEYSCDSYPCNPHNCNCSCTSRDSNGNCTSESCQTCWDTCYHDCPYATEEWVRKIDTTLGDTFTIDDHVFGPNPIAWRPGKDIPGNVQRGASQFWLDAKARVDSGSPGPACARKEYKNYLLASDKTILKSYSDMIQKYKDAGLIPALRTDVRDFYYADKVYFVGFSPEDPHAWQVYHSYLNAAFGTELQGDLHLVLVQNDSINLSPDAYINALKAEWQNPETQGKNALSKNAVIVVLGTDGKMIIWGRATTGMPIGNEGLIVGVRSYFSTYSGSSVPATPEAVIGRVSGEFYTKVDEETGETKIKVRGKSDDVGALRKILWGLTNPSTKFARISMSGDDSDDNGNGFAYLASQIEPTDAQKWVIGIIVFILSLVGAGFFAYYGESKYNSYRRY